MKKTVTIIAAIVIALGITAYFFFSSVTTDKISKQQALQIAMNHAGIEASQVLESDVDYENENGRKYYEVEIETADRYEHKYYIDPFTGEVIGGGKK